MRLLKFRLFWHVTTGKIKSPPPGTLFSGIYRALAREALLIIHRLVSPAFFLTEIHRRRQPHVPPGAHQHFRFAAPTTRTAAGVAATPLLTSAAWPQGLISMGWFLLALELESAAVNRPAQPCTRLPTRVHRLRRENDVVPPQQQVILPSVC